VTDGNLLLVRPSCGNLHKFVAEEDSCFFDICLPNYTNDSLRRITYFNEISEQIECPHTNHSLSEKCATKIEYSTTPPVLPDGMEIAELSYVGDMKEDQRIY